MSIRELPIFGRPAKARRGRAAAAMLLRTFSRALDALAARLAVVERRHSAEPVLEFHAEAGAPEGALYVDGQIIGHLRGVNRL